MKARAFLDTNVLVYAALGSDGRSQAAQRLIQTGGVISVQVLNEFTNVAYRKFRQTWDAIRDALKDIQGMCDPVLP